MRHHLINKTINRIKEWNKRWPRAVVLWSGGKDSTALLHLIRYGAGIDIPVIQYRQPKFRERYAYSDYLIKEWNLDIPKPTIAQLDALEVQATTVENNQRIISTRKSLYGAWDKQLEEIYDNGIDSWKARITNIKLNNPKE
jgi:3'-phosphoadenosine 5'-phosphosulfate sulfotransferase (PAPS reductase)/FAD synthetase